LAKYPVTEEAQEWLAWLRENQRISEEDLKAGLLRAHLENEPRRLLRKLIAACRENSGQDEHSSFSCGATPD
jgi:hypothetical protein